MQTFGMTNKEHYGMLWYFLEWPILWRRYPSRYCLLNYEQTFSSLVAIYHENDGETSGGVAKCRLFSYLWLFLVYRVLGFKPIFRGSPYSI